MSHHLVAAHLAAAAAGSSADAQPATPPAGAYPAALARLLDGSGATRDGAWAAFLDEYGFLLLHAARSVSTDRDEAMDAYAHLLGRLRDDDFRALRAYAVDPRSKFTTWLVVVARRACVDLYRSRYGREQSSTTEVIRQRRRVRRRIEDLIAADADVGDVIDDASPDMTEQLMAAELSRAVTAAVEGLAPGDQLLLKLRFTDELSAAEIATLLRLPSPFHVYRRVNALLQTLRRALSRRGVDGPGR